MRTANPALSARTFRDLSRSSGDTMTLSGTVNKTGFLLLLLIASASYTWQMFYNVSEMDTPPPMGLWAFGSVLGAFAMALITVFKKEWAMYTGPLYALLEGLALGCISSLFEMRYPGIVVQAVALTFGTLFGLLAAYRSGLIRATENFKLGVAAATMGIMVFYLVGMVARIFFQTEIPMIHDSGWAGIAFSAFVVVIAALNLVLDFDFIEQGVAHGAPKYMEWYAAFGLMVTLVWLYLEILRLLSKGRSRR